MTARKLVIFDVDGTLIDSQDHILAAMAHAFAAAGLGLPRRDAVLSIVGLSLPEAFAALVPDISDDLRARLVADYKASFGPLRARVASGLYAGARDALDHLRGRDDMLMGIATGKSRRGLDHVLGAAGLQGYFVTCQVADDHPSKPHPAMLLAALAETGIAADMAVMIGDTSFDVEMGRAAGMATIGVGWGYHPVPRLRAAGAGQVIGSYAALIPALERIWGAQ